jgi:hypothetical protein
LRKKSPQGETVTKEIRKEKDWLGNEKEVIYEDGEKTGEIHNEETLFGAPVKREYDNEGRRVSETRHEHTFGGTPVERTYVVLPTNLVSQGLVF